MPKAPPILPPHLEVNPSWISWSTSARVLGHPLVWLGSTFLLLALGYFWLQSIAVTNIDLIDQDPSSTSHIGNQNKANWNPPTKAAPKTIDIMAISQTGDDIRADKFRDIIEKENFILPLLKTARTMIDNGQLTGTGNDNAWQNYQAILDIDPQHNLASNGQTQIIVILQENAADMVNKKQYEQAEHWLGQLDQITIDNVFQIELRQRISLQINADLIAKQAKQHEFEQRQVINAALDDAKFALNDSPPNFRAAYDLYSHALNIDDDNQRALDGLNQIHQQRIILAQTAISKNDFTLAKAHINRLMETQANAQQVTQLQNILSNIQNQAASKPTIKPKPSSLINNAQISPLNQSSSINLSDDKLTKKDNNVSTIRTKNPSTKTDTKRSQQKNQIARIDTNAQNTQASNLSLGIAAYYTGDYDIAFKHLHPLAVSGETRAQFRLGIMYNQGRTVVQNENLARQWIVRALPDILRQSEQGVAWAQADLGTVYEFGLGLDKNLVRAASWYAKAAEQGYAGAQTNLGVLFITGEGVKYDRQRALYWLKQAARQGDKIAQDNLLILNAR